MDLLASCVVVIPIYKSYLNEYEQLSVQRNFEVIQSTAVYFLMADSLNEQWYRNFFPKIKIKKISSKYFWDFSSYNRLLMSEMFYDLWVAYDKILICQTDVFMFSNRLEEFLQMPYDYFGAPLVRLKEGSFSLYGGNGGFSLRDLNQCKRLLHNHQSEVNCWQGNEDEFFSCCGELYPDEFRIAPLAISSSFAFDRFGRFLYEMKSQHLPFAMHGWYTYDIDFSKILIEKSGTLINYLPKLLTRIQRKSELEIFLKQQKRIYLYGAGIWGIAFAAYFKELGIPFEGFVVSDDQNISQQQNDLGNIYHLKELTGKYNEIGIVMTISPRFTDQNVFHEIYKQIQNIGITKIFEMDVILYTMAVEAWFFSKFDLIEWRNSNERKYTGGESESRFTEKITR